MLWYLQAQGQGYLPMTSPSPLVTATKSFQVGRITGKLTHNGSRVLQKGEVTHDKRPHGPRAERAASPRPQESQKAH